MLFATLAEKLADMHWTVRNSPRTTCLTAVIQQSAGAPRAIIVQRKYAGEGFGSRLSHAEVLRRGVLFRQDDTDIYFTEPPHDPAQTD